MADDGEQYLDRADGASVDGAAQTAITAPLLALAAGLAMMVEAFFDGISGFFGVLDDARVLIGSFLTEPIPVLTAGAEASANAAAQFGIAAFPVTVAVVAVGVLLADRLITEVPFLDTILPWR